MDNEKVTKKWHKTIINECQNRLGRKLTDKELSFIESRKGFIALEMITDTVKSLQGQELEQYLNHE